MEAYEGEVAPERWAQAWDRLYDRYGSAAILVVGGEPLHYRGAEKLLPLVARDHFVSLITNLSLPDDKLAALTAALPPERVRFGATFHPEFGDADALRRRLSDLKARGFGTWLTVVAWPPLLESLPRWRDFFAEAGILFSVCVFFGTHEGKTYPEAYTQEQRAFLDPFLCEFDREHQLRRRPTKGLPCAAGLVYGKIRANGDVYRCGSLADYRPDSGGTPAGSVFDPAFRLADSAAPCPLALCECGESRYLAESYGKSHPLARVVVRRPA
jgi:MoaA/NifB/PqqE/SkfB family radical SAM enzyme